MNARQVQTDFRALGDAEDAVHLARFFKTGPGDYGEGDRFLGIRVPAIRKTAGHYAELPLRSVTALLKSPYHEERLLALLIMVRQFKTGRDDERRHLYDAYLAHTRWINNWDLVDLSAEHIPGAWLQSRSRRPLYRLTESEWLWDRRIAMLATFHYIKRNDFEDALAIAAMLLNDRHDLIHKAVGWMLREIGNRDRAREEAFLNAHLRAMPRTMLRYAIERFPEALRLRYLRA